MSRKKYWIQINISTRDSHATRAGSYRTCAPTVTTYQTSMEIRKRKTVDILKLIFECVKAIVQFLES